MSAYGNTLETTEWYATTAPKTIPSIPVHKIYQHLLNNTLPIMPFDMDKESTEHTGSIWTLFSHPGLYITAIGLLISAGLGLFCCYFFWCQPARLVANLYNQVTCIYNCGCWCRSSTHLQMQWQGSPTYKTLWESWSDYRAFTYMARESI